MPSRRSEQPQGNTSKHWTEELVDKHGLPEVGRTVRYRTSSLSRTPQFEILDVIDLRDERRLKPIVASNAAGKVFYLHADQWVYTVCEDCGGDLDDCLGNCRQPAEEEV